MIFIDSYKHIYENVFLKSEEFENAAWLKGQGMTVTSNATTSPFGQNTADRLNTVNTIENFIYQLYPNAGIKTISVYAKQNTNRYLWAYGGFTGTTYGALFDLQTGVVTTTNTVNTVSSLSITTTSAAITNEGNGWYRCSVTYTLARGGYAGLASTNNGSATFDMTNNMTSGTITIGSIFVWGAQLQNSGTLAPYQQAN